MWFCSCVYPEMANSSTVDMKKYSLYSFSFTAASLRLNEMIKVAGYAIENPVTALSQIKKLGVVFGSVKSRTSDRQFREISKRLETLTSAQLEILNDSDLQSQKHMALLAICKHNLFIRDFIIEVIREKTLVYNYQLNQSDFGIFINAKQQNNPELESFSDSTLKKARQVMFHIFEQAGLINNIHDLQIQPQLLSSAVIKAITADNRDLLKIFLYPDRDINELMY